METAESLYAYQINCDFSILLSHRERIVSRNTRPPMTLFLTTRSSNECTSELLNSARDVYIHSKEKNFCQLLSSRSIISAHFECRGKTHKKVTIKKDLQEVFLLITFCIHLSKLLPYQIFTKRMSKCIICHS